MIRIPFAQIDAFTDRAFGGNPAAVMPLDHWLDDATLQAIAAENNLSETAFLVPATGDAEFELRWFTPVSEVRLCGHATLASGHFVLSSGTATAERVRFRTRLAGVLEVSREDAGYALALPAWEPVPTPMPDVVEALGVTAVETLYRDGGYRVVVVADEATVRRVTPDLRRLAEGGDRQTIVTARGETADVVSRMFAPGAGVDEDPVTGSAHAVITPYWVKILGRDSFSAYQASARGGRIGCRLAGNRVILTGQCVTVIEGTFLF